MLGLQYKWHVLTVVVIGGFMVMLEITIVNIALPSIMNSFNTSLSRAQLVISMYMLALALIIPTTGFFGDRLGTKRLYTLSVAGFTLGSVLCGLAWDINSLILFRVLQGLAGGMTMPLGMAMLFRTVPRSEQGFFLSLFGLPILLAPILGPILGGYLVETASWRMVFFINVPVGLLGIAIASRLLRETEEIQGLPFDFKGFMLGGIGLTTALLALTRVPEHGWTAADVVVLFSVSGTALAAFVFVELTDPAPLLDLRVFRIPMFALAVSLSLVAVVALISGVFLMPIFLQNVRGMSPIDTGILLMPQALAAAVVLPFAGRLYDRVGPRPLIIIGLIGLSYALFQLHNLNLSTSDSTLVKILVLRGASMGLLVVSTFTLTLSLVPRAQLTRASALANSLRQLAPAFAITAFATILITRQTFHSSNLAQTVTPDSLAVQQVLSSVGTAASQSAVANGQAQQTALQILDGLVQSQAAVNAFDDVFLISAIGVLVAVLPALFLHKPKSEEVQPASETTSAPQPAD